MSTVAKRALMAALTVVGLVLLVTGAWFTFNLGTSGSATFRSVPAQGSIFALAPSVLNRVDSPVTVTAVAKGGEEVWIGRTAPTDAAALVGGADRTTVTGASVRDWSLVQSRAGAGTAPPLDTADIWRQSVTGDGTARMRVDQANAPETLVIAAPDGSPVDLASLTLTIERRTWFFQALLAALVGLLATVAGAAGFWHSRSRSQDRSEHRSEPEATKPGANGQPDGTDEPTQEVPA